MNLYRTGGDIGPAFTSVIGESYATVQYNDRPDPFSRPGCWACELLSSLSSLQQRSASHYRPLLPTDPDMQEIGNFNGPDPLRTDEENTHWGCVGCLPLLYLTCGLTAMFCVVQAVVHHQRAPDPWR